MAKFRVEIQPSAEQDLEFFPRAMKTIQLQHAPPELVAVLEMAAQEGVLIEDEQGNQFLLERVDAFDVEVAQLGSSESFLAFLAERSRETAGKSIEEIAAGLGLSVR